MLTFKTLELKNFMSFGNITQSINFDLPHLSLIMGENLDIISDAGNNRNGVGKSSLGNAICFALFGEAISSIKMDNLINLTNEKGMEVSLTFETNGITYCIKRGRKPNYFSFFVKDNNTAIIDNTAQGDPKKTQEEIERIIGFSCDMFKQIISLNTISLPFLSLPAKNQRSLIEELLRISELSTKAENLKENIKTTKEMIVSEESKLTTIKDSNEKIQKSVDDLKRRNNAWTIKHQESITNLETSISNLLDLDVDKEIETHKTLSMFKTLSLSLNKLKKDKVSKNSQINDLTKRKAQYEDNLKSIENNLCPTCNQHIHNDKNIEIKESTEKKLNDVGSQLITSKNELYQIDLEIIKNELDITNLGKINDTFYKSIDEAYSHRSKLEAMALQLQSLSEEQNPYDCSMISQQENLLQILDTDYLQQLVSLKDHQEFLYKLLTNKDSSVRKRIIEQNLNYLNNRLKYYTEKLGLPHSVTFLNDLTTNITEHGRELDFGNLSTGERIRLVLGLSFSFRDVFESVGSSINMLFIDETIDQGIDSAGLEAAVKLLKSMSRDQNKSVFIISHREELIPRVDSVIMIRKENGFSSIVNSETEEDVT